MLTPDLPQVLGDRVQLQQVMLNLIMNAIEAMNVVTDRARILRLARSKQVRRDNHYRGKTADRELIQRTWIIFLKRFLRQSPTEWGWACQFAAQSWKPMVGGFPQRHANCMAQSSNGSPSSAVKALWNGERIIQ